VAMNLADLAGMAALVAAGGAAGYAAFERSLRRAVLERQQATERQLNALAVTLKALEARVAELTQIPELQAAAAQDFEMEAAPPAAIEADHGESEKEEVPAEIMAVIAAAANAFLGKKVRILSANLLQSPYESVSPWSQQGRVFVQSSHNLRSRGRD